MLKQLLEDLTDQVVAGTLESGRAAVAAQLVNTRIRLMEYARRAREQEELEERMSEIERRLEAAHGRRRGPRITYGAKRGRASLAVRLERAERSEALHTDRLDEEGRIRVDPSTYVLLRRLGELDPALLEAYFRTHYGHIRDPWREAGQPPPTPEKVQEAGHTFSELWREERAGRQLAEKSGDRLIMALWHAYARERDDLRAGKPIHPACVTSDNGWLIRPESVEQKRPRDISFWLAPFRRAVDDREWDLREEGAAPVEDHGEAERLATERAQNILDSHLRHGRYICDWLGVPFDDPSDGGADGER